MSDKVVVISGTDYNISGIQELGEFNSDSHAEVVSFNKFGYVGIRVDGKEDIVKRHLSDCEDIRSMTIGSAVKNLKFEDGRWVVIHDGVEMSSENVYIIKLFNQCGEEVYMARSSIGGHTTRDITKAWFTFIKEQAVNYANKKTIMNMRAYTAVNVEDIIELQHYV